MTGNNDKKYGRTFFDLIAEHPKFTFFVILSLLLIAIGLLIFGIHLKIGNVEVGKNNIAIPDTIIRTKIDTQYIEKSPNIVKSRSLNRQSRNLTKEVSIKLKDSIIREQNKSANINTGTNNGIIGDNNEVNVNVNEIQRKLDERSKIYLLQLINETIKRNNLTNPCYRLSSISGSNEAFVFASEIEQFLKQQNIQIEAIGLFQRAPIIKGVEIGIDFDKCVTILVGYRK